MIIHSSKELIELGKAFGGTLHGGEVIELLGDVGAGKTTFTQGIAAGLGIKDDVTSPSFTISNQYQTPNGLLLKHYDFYRLNDAGLMSDELAETLADPQAIVVVEWADAVDGVLPSDRQKIEIKYLPDGDGREILGVEL